MTRTRRGPRRSPLVRTTVALLCVIGLLAGCDLRVETPAPTAPSPGAQETVRQRAATDAVDLAALADAAAGGPTEPAVLETLTLVAATSRLHADALGGVWTPWTTTPSAADESASPTPSTAPPTPTPDEVALALQAAADRAADDADVVADGGLARLLASISTSRALLAADLTAGLTGSVLVLPTEAAAEPDAAEAAVPVAGLQDSSVLALLEAEDALGAGWEVLAARSGGDDRARAALVAAGHRDRAQAWAEALDVDGTALDSRSAAYALPAAVLDPDGDATAALLDLEVQLGERLAALVGRADPGARAPLLLALRDNAFLVRRAGGTTPSFPGLAEVADDTPTGDPTG